MTFYPLRWLLAVCFYHFPNCPQRHSPTPRRHSAFQCKEIFKVLTKKKKKKSRILSKVNFLYHELKIKGDLQRASFMFKIMFPFFPLGQNSLYFNQVNLPQILTLDNKFIYHKLTHYIQRSFFIKDVIMLTPSLTLFSSTNYNGCKRLSQIIFPQCHLIKPRTHS